MVDEREYWEGRHETYKDSRAVGRTGWKHAKNEESHAQSNAQLVRVLQQFDLESPKILDLGFGHGHRANICSELGAVDYVGIDIAGVNKVGPAGDDYTYLKGDICEPNKTIREHGPYDVVLLVDVMYHILGMGRFKTALRNAQRWCKPGGYIVVTDLFHIPPKTSPHVNRRNLAHYCDVLGTPLETRRWRDNTMVIFRS